jgi:ABC-type multidrug transport system ATPase subunit
MMRRESISDSSKDDANVCDHTDDNQMNYETSSNRSLLCDFIGPLDGIAEHCDSEDDDNDVDALMMRLPSPVTVEPQQAFDLPPLRPTASLGFDDRRDDPSRNQGSASSGSAVCPDLRSRLISHDSWFLLFPNSTKNSNGNHFDRENAEESSTVERSRSSEKVPSVAKFAKDEEVNDTASDEASSTLSAEATPPGTTLRPPSMIPGRTRFATYDAIASPSRYQGRRRLSSYDASSLRHRLERVSSSRQGAGRPVWALRRGSLFHRNEARPSYMQTLVLKKQLREHFADLRQDANVPKTDSSIAKELLRQVESFDESASKLRESWQNQYPSSVEDDEGIEVITSRKDADVMASRKDADNFVVLDQNKRKRPSSSTPLEIRQQDYPPSPRDNDLHELVRQVLVEDHVKELSHKLKEIHALVRPYVREGISVESAFTAAPFPLQVRLKDMSYTVKLSKEFGKRNMVLETEGVRPGRAIHSICTFSTHMLSWIWKYLQRAAQCQPQVPRTRHGDLPRKNVLQSVNLIIEPGQNYLVLGPPGSGKSTLLKAIAGLLPLQDPFDMQGEITYNGKTIHDCAKEKIFIENAFGYIDQLDNHAPLLTVRETLEFAYQCKTGNRKKSSSVLKHRLQNQTPIDVDDEMESATSSGRIQQIDLDLSRKAKEDRLTLNVILAVLGLTEVQDTFVGNSTTIRGVSGGQKRRVTIGEMLMSQTPILCGDEISTGLDSETTYVMVETLLHFSRIMGYSRVFSLLQPSPEVVSLFDQIIVLGEGYILFAGKIEEVEEYFAHLGFRSPEFMDLADFLQLVSTDDRESLFEGDGLCPTVKELAYIFQHRSPQGADIQTLLNSPHDNKLDAHGSVQTRNGQSLQISAVQCKYANGFFRSLKLIAIRFLVLWVRDKQALSFSVVRNIINGSSVGGAFFNASDFLSISGALFQTGIFVLLGSLQTLAGLVTERSIFDKQSNANFFSAWPYVLGKNLSQVPQTFLLDSLLSGGLLYFMTGLGGRTNLANFATYVLILFVFACATNQQMAAFASFASESRLQVYAACFLFVSILFCGFLISPDVLPEYFLVFWYMNPFQWCYSAVILNEVYSGRWENPEAILEANGFVTLRNSVKSGHWIWWGVLFVVCYFVTCTVWTAVGLARSARRRIGGEAFVGAAPEDSWNGEDNSITGNETVAEAAQARYLFQPVTLSFKDLCYEVKASTTNDKLVLLKGISGIFHPGRMCALMGESGAGKTTLLDVISLRKHSGIRTGTVWINGFEQSEVPLRRCSGYVEQFDVQSPELTVLETILFSARLRLDPKIIRTEEMTKAFCKQVLEDVELNELAHCLVGNEDGAGLSFDQRKRLSIAVELAASPSVLFLCVIFLCAELIVVVGPFSPSALLYLTVTNQHLGWMQEVLY